MNRPGKTRWTVATRLWVSDVFAWRGSLAAWREDIVKVTGVRVRSPDEKEQHKLRRLGDGVQIATLSSMDAEPLEVATWPRSAPRSSDFLATDLEKGVDNRPRGTDDGLSSRPRTSALRPRPTL